MIAFRDASAVGIFGLSQYEQTLSTHRRSRPASPNGYSLAKVASFFVARQRSRRAKVTGFTTQNGPLSDCTSIQRILRLQNETVLMDSNQWHDLILIARKPTTARRFRKRIYRWLKQRVRPPLKNIDSWIRFFLQPIKCTAKSNRFLHS